MVLPSESEMSLLFEVSRTSLMSSKLIRTVYNAISNNYHGETPICEDQPND